MEIKVDRCAGLDVHRDSIVAVVLIGSRQVKKELRKFGTTARELAALRAWLREHKVTQVAMEATGVYWFPVLACLEGLFELVVANAHHIKNLPGRKTDACDAEWLATLLRYGLIKGSFVPPPWQRELRVLTRGRRNLAHSITRERNAVLKLLESIGIKLASVLSDVFGKSGMAMLRQLVQGNEDPEQLSALAKGRLRKKAQLIVEALEGRTLASAHRLALRLSLDRLDSLDTSLQEFEAAIDQAIKPYLPLIIRLCGIHGIDRNLAAVVLAEVGPNVDAFQTAAQFAAWSGACPGNARSANTTRSVGVRKGNVNLLTCLVQAAVSASRTKKPTYLSTKYRRIAARRGPKRAAVAVAHKIVIAIYHMIRDGTQYKDLGPTYLDAANKSRTASRLLQRLRDLGYEVTATNTVAQEASPV